ncbi:MULTISPECIES: MmcQ/YjbR family DNA-binding protein [unclassified Knoellia]|uniref:MmcQ/YjbR family DNA-binding protein n=1 Tax=Knoellia altitudinis TaxID=3404795 RepID=UPI00361D6E32
MTPEEVTAYALAKPGAWADQPWEGDDVAKVGDKIFAFLGGLGAADGPRVGVKLGSRAEADEWIAEFPDDASVSPYIGRHGWNTLAIGGAIPDDALREAIDTSYDLVVAKLPRGQRPASSSSSSS